MQVSSWDKVLECVIELFSSNMNLPMGRRKFIESLFSELTAPVFNPGKSLLVAPKLETPLIIDMDQIHSFRKCFSFQLFLSRG